VPVIPTLLLSVMPFKVQAWMYAVPLMGQQIAITRLLRGDNVLPSSMLMSFACTTVAVIVLCAIAAQVYRSERLAISA